MALYIIMVLCISCRQLFCLLYILNAVVSCFVHLMCPKQLTIAFFLSPLLLSLLLALIKVACVAVLFFQRCVLQCRQGHSFLQCARCRKRGYGSSCPCFNVSATLIYWSKGNCFVDRWTSICDTLQQVEFISKFSLQLATGQGASEKRNELHSQFRPLL